MDLYGIGFSNIRMANESNNYVYKYDSRINIFPEEVFVHEFIHTLERNSKDNGYEIPEMHGHADYGYEEEKLIGLKNWYADYMNCEVLDKKTNTYVGLPKETYLYKPAHKSDFNYAIEMEFNNEPQNILEEIIGMLKTIVNEF